MTTPEYKKLKNQATDIAPDDWKAALNIANEIKEPWFKCQALAAAAKYCNFDKERVIIIDDAFSEADKLEEPNWYLFPFFATC